ncbi:zinc ribbon domain-containing protein [Azotobacter beijerinckii]|uniref:zinc ribbon domain-containing protein n=1 Tax=Azotobacter beijerinckii TaxID=170623 RepID=UPI000B87ED30|nr:zinc ribbon domain-containing protein [Azotobacter beijerinckii]
MALINCPECNAEISDNALRCPRCGVQLRKPKRGLLGKLIKFSFILFNLLMIIWLVAGMGAATEGMEAMSEVEKTGTAIGAGIGFAMIMSIWVCGDIILGVLVLLTRPKV